MINSLRITTVKSLPNLARSLHSSQVNMSKVTVINSFDQFKQVIAKGPAVFDFHAVWCGPCKFISPKFEELSKENDGVEFFSVDVDEQPEVASECGITAMPTFMLFKDGQKVDSLRGALPEKLIELVKKGASL